MKPLLSIVIAVYNVEEFVNATLVSFDRQTIDSSLVEYVFVDDGSTDNSLRIVEAWARGKCNVKIIRQENQGAGAARKAALEVVSGDWVTVVDPDDILDRSYFSAIQEFIHRDTSSVADMLVTRVMVLNGSTGRAYDTHPLGYRFKKGSRLVSLNMEPSCIQLGATAVLRTSRLRDNQLTYDPRIEPTFEDAHLLGRYLAKSADPVVGLVADAKYFYRKRPDQSSLVQSSWSIESRYSTVLELGYLDMLLSVKSEYGYVPKWAQNMVLYDLVWYFKEETKQHSKTAWISGKLRDEFLVLLMQIFDLIDADTIKAFTVNPMWWTMRQTLLGFFKRDYALNNRVIQWGPDKIDGSNQYCILTFGDEPKIEIYVDGLKAIPASDNFTVHSYFGVPMMTERNFRIGKPGRTRIFVDGRAARIERAVTKVSEPVSTANMYSLAPKETPKPFVISSLERVSGRVPFVGLATRNYSLLSRKFRYIQSRLEVESLALSENPFRVSARAVRNVVSKSRASSLSVKSSVHAKQLIGLSSTQSVRSKYHNAWIVMDRPMRADDNGEHFYRYLYTNRPDINSYFLLKRESPDWDRLDAEGFNLIEYGSDESVLALLNADYRFSSDAVAEVMYPISRHKFDLTKSRFIFLQHGVTKDDLSRWLNPKKLDGIVCATFAEYDSIAGKNSPYTIKSDQALLTGFPRFDRLHELISNREEEGDLILIMPTWRQYLRDELEKLDKPEQKSRAFNDSDFGRNWLQVLNSPELRDLAKTHGKRIGFIAHPAFAELIQHLDIPEHVEVLDTSVFGFQNLLIQSCIFVTDYSSVAFDAANIDIPVVYFQFDPEAMFGGGHNFRKGYFEYERDGFGPVAVSPSDAVSQIRNSFEDVHFMDIYRKRAKETFPYSDANNSERLVRAIFELK